MNSDNAYANQVLLALVELLDISPSYYDKATERYKSLGEWLHRKESQVGLFSPSVYVQGSFMYGTVIRPLMTSEEYDLDLVCQLNLSKMRVSQRDVKELVGDEVKAYAKAMGIAEPAREKKRCWRLDYADEAKFHMDILPAVPDPEFQTRLLIMEVRQDIAAQAVAITDREHPRYTEVQDDWPESNPKGFTRWFEGRMRPVAQLLLESLVARRLYASVDHVPLYAWKTPLQRAIQILKRHRDIMFKDDVDGKPISMIITTLAARCYGGERELQEALSNIIRKMPEWVRDARPRIANPVHPKEDFADKWHKHPRLEENFWAWHTQAQADLTAVTRPVDESRLRRLVRQKFGADISQERTRTIVGTAVAAGGAAGASAPAIVTIKEPPRPWA